MMMIIMGVFWVLLANGDLFFGDGQVFWPAITIANIWIAASIVRDSVSREK